MEIITRNVKDLIAAEYNPRQLTDTQASSLRDSLKRFGMVDPVIVNRHPDRRDIVVGGHQRLRVWREMGNETIPTVEVELNRDKERELNVRLNKNTGEWNWDALANEFGIDELTDWGFDEAELVNAEWVDYSDQQKGNATRANPGSASMLVCFGEFAGRVDLELGKQALDIINAFDDDPNTAATILCRRLIDAG